MKQVLSFFSKCFFKHIKIFIFLYNLFWGQKSAAGSLSKVIIWKIILISKSHDVNALTFTKLHEVN